MADSFDNLKDKAADIVDNAGGRLDADVKALREDIGKLTTSVGDLVKSQASTAKSTMVGMMGDAREKVADHASDAKDRVSAVTADVQAVVKGNPLVAIVAALIAGLLMGVVSRSRK